MWSDNETLNDLIGFEYLVDQIELVVTEKRLRPVTLGVLGGWGSGKTSLIRMAEVRLRERGYVCTSFSPWRFEDYDDIKHALMSSVIARLESELPADGNAPARELFEKVKDAARRLRIPRIAGTAGTLLATGEPGIATAAGEVAESLTAEADNEPTQVFESVAEFRTEFRQLLEALELEALVVFIDDLDRCLPPTVVSTLEALRLFLHVEKTAYVVAADPEVIRGSVESEYPVTRTVEGDLGTDYLEKILQFTVTVPPLSAPEVETYVSLLLAELTLNDDDVKLLRETARKRRSEDQLAVAMNLGIAGEALEEVSSKLQSGFGLSSRIAKPLAEGTRGNPREIKRFLNTLTLRRSTAAKRGTTLEPDALAKLMLLEERQSQRFQELFAWQLAGDGRAPQLAEAEASARDEAEREVGADAMRWLNDERLVDWLRLDPPLADVDLGPYFSYSRDRLARVAPAARLTGTQQALLHRLLDESDAVRRPAKAEFAGLLDDERAEVYAVLLERTVAAPSSSGMRLVGELASDHDALVPALVEGLERLPAEAVPLPTPPQYRQFFAQDRRFDSIFAHWEERGPASAKASKKR